jgi:hypothetical protein
MDLPSLLNLTISRPVGGELPANVQVGTSKVTALSMTLDEMGGRAFLALVRMPAQLQRLIISRKRGLPQRGIRCRHAVHDGLIGRALDLHKEALQSLEINGPKSCLCPKASHTLKSLHDFPRLIEIILPPQLFYHRRDRAEHVRALSHLLPASLDKVVLNWDPSDCYTSTNFSWTDIVEDLSQREHQICLKNITIRLTCKMQIMRCIHCEWSAVVCARCVRTKNLCQLCYPGPCSRSMEKSCLKAGIALWGPWMGNQRSHSSDHAGHIIIVEEPRGKEPLQDELSSIFE